MYGKTYATGYMWRRRAAALSRSALRPIAGRLARETDKAFLIETPIRSAWVPKRLVTHDAERGVFMVPGWLATEKALD